MKVFKDVSISYSIEIEYGFVIRHVFQKTGDSVQKQTKVIFIRDQYKGFRSLNSNEIWKATQCGYEISKSLYSRSLDNSFILKHSKSTWDLPPKAILFIKGPNFSSLTLEEKNLALEQGYRVESDDEKFSGLNISFSDWVNLDNFLGVVRENEETDERTNSSTKNFFKFNDLNEYHDLPDLISDSEENILEMSLSENEYPRPLDNIPGTGLFSPNFGTPIPGEPFQCFCASCSNKNWFDNFLNVNKDTKETDNEELTEEESETEIISSLECVVESNDSEDSNESNNSDDSEDTEDSEDSNESNTSDDSDKSNDSTNSDDLDDSNNDDSNESNNSDDSDESNDSNDSNESNNSNDSNESNESNDSNESDDSDDSNESNNSDDLDESNESNNSDESNESNNSCNSSTSFEEECIIGRSGSLELSEMTVSSSMFENDSNSNSTSNSSESDEDESEEDNSPSSDEDLSRSLNSPLQFFDGLIFYEKRGLIFKKKEDGKYVAIGKIYPESNDIFELTLDDIQFVEGAGIEYKFLD